jgi:hypothetical protein
MEFPSLESLAMHLTSSAVADLKNVKHGLEASALLIEITAKAEIGHYQPAVGPFQEWAPLAQSTEDEKARLGYPADAPLERTLALHDSITHETEEWEATIGSTDQVMEYQEFGTDKIPPRPVIGTALYRNLKEIQRLIGNAAVSGFVGGDPIHPSLGYEVEGSAD